jgi:hypothetical protein
MKATQMQRDIRADTSQPPRQLLYLPWVIVQAWHYERRDFQVTVRHGIFDTAFDSNQTT